MRYLFFIAISLIVCTGYAQTDSVSIEGTEVKLSSAQDSARFKHSPKKAALLSLIPGGGQIYNKKYWKVPLIYAAGGAAVYFAANNYKNYQLFRNTLISRVDSNSNKIDNFPNITTAGVQSEMETHQKNFELLVIASIAVYAIQIVDATVDAHLMYFDVSDELAIQVEPRLMNLNNLIYHPQQPTASIGLSLKLHLK